MTLEDKKQVQAVVVEYLQFIANEHPTMLLDALLSGDGFALVHHVLSSQAAYSQKRADGLNLLLRAIAAERPQVAPQAPAEPQPPPGRLPMPGGL